MTAFPSGCTKQSDRHAQPSSVTDPDEGRGILARISSADAADIYKDVQGLNLMDSRRQLDGQDHPPIDTQRPGQLDVDPISARTP